MSNRRRLRPPAETAAMDQALAAARNLAQSDPKLGVMVTVDADGQQCSWCDCEVGPNSPHLRDGYRCAGCPKAADVVVMALYGTPDRFDAPACKGHFPLLIADLTRMLSGSRPG